MGVLALGGEACGDVNKRMVVAVGLGLDAWENWKRMEWVGMRME